MKLRKMMALMLSAAMMLSVAACGTKTEGAAPLGEKKTVSERTDTEPGYVVDAEEKITLDWYVNLSWYVGMDEESAVAKEIEDKTGVKINMIVPAGNESEKMNSMIATDALPDIITLGSGDGALEDMIDAGMLYPLNELADEYDPYFYQVASAERLAWFQKEDGNTYCYPQYSYTPDDYDKFENIVSTRSFLVRKDIYEALGSPDMSTPEGFLQAIRDAVKMYPEVNGQPLIPFTMHEFFGDNYSIYILMDFLSIPYEKDGSVYDRISDPEMIKWLKVFRQLYEEGYLVDDVFIDDRTAMDEKATQGRYFCMLYQWTDVQDPNNERYKEDPDSYYICVEGPRNSNGEDPKLPGPGIGGWLVTLVSKNCKAPDRAIELISYLLSEEGQKTCIMGPEGVGYTNDENGNPVEIPEIARMRKEDPDTYGKEIGGQVLYMLEDTPLRNSWMVDESEPNGSNGAWTCKYAYDTSVYSYNIPLDSEFFDIQVKCDNLWCDTLPKLLTAPSEAEFDSLFDNYLSKRAELGYDELQNEFTRQLIENKKKLGMD